MNALTRAFATICTCWSSPSRTARLCVRFQKSRPLRKMSSTSSAHSNGNGAPNKKICHHPHDDSAHCSSWYDDPIPFNPEVFALNRQRLVHALKHQGFSDCVAVLQGGEALERHETDHEELFRQESNFAWAFGVKEPGCYGCIDISSGKSMLFVPKYPPEYGIWMGPIRTLESFKSEYRVDDVKFVDDIQSTFTSFQPPRGPTLLTTRGLNTDTGRRAQEATFPGVEAFRVNNGVLYDAICEMRAIKTGLEQDILRRVCALSSRAHAEVMRQVKPGMKEYQLESIFLHYAYFCGGSRHTSYTSICGCGPNGATLHYGHAGAPNDRLIKDGDMCLMDMGAEGRFYGSDITCSFPANGRFTSAQSAVYETVLAAQQAVMRALKPGVFYVDMQELAYKVICEGLRDRCGVLKGDIGEMMKCNLAATFMPHGLGHMLGIDTHDVAGKPEFSTKLKRDTRAGFAKLRLLRPLEENMYITVEPGIYFVDYLLDLALKDESLKQFINPEKLAAFRGFGGVRIEDDVLITANGCVNFTRCPRTVADIEAWMCGKITDLNALDCPFSPKY